jgi:argininosuccinate lyase
LTTSLQWGGRFSEAPDPALIAYGSSLTDDLVLAEFDVRCSHGHVVALAEAKLLDARTAQTLHAALDTVAQEIARGEFVGFARTGMFEDVHGAIDARVRALTPPEIGELLHAGRSRNDQVATTLLLYARDRAERGAAACAQIAGAFLVRAREALERKTLLAATTHWQPAQPVLFAFWLHAAAQPFVRAAVRFERVRTDAARTCPLGSGAVSGSSLALARAAAARYLGFAEPSPNALDSVGDRDVALDLLSAVTRAVVAASRPSEEFVVWSTPAFGYARLGDAAATGSSLMPQKRNPDPFELVRAAAPGAIGALTAALGTTAGIGLSYHRDLQGTKAHVIRGTESGLATLDAFGRAFGYLAFDEARMTAAASRGFTTATDVADALIARGVTARQAHRIVGAHVAASEAGQDAFAAGDLAALRDASGIADLRAPLDAAEAVDAKQTPGSTNPALVAEAIRATERELAAITKPS